MAQPDVRNEVITARKLLLMVQDGIALSRGRNADDYGVVIRDCARKRYYYRVDKALKDLEKLLMLIPTEVQRVADKSESTVIRNFLTDLSIALSKEKAAGRVFPGAAPEAGEGDNGTAPPGPGRSGLWRGNGRLLKAKGGELSPFPESIIFSPRLAGKKVSTANIM